MSIGLLFAIVRVECELRRIEAKLWDVSIGEGFCLGHARARRHARASGSRRHGVNGPQQTGVRWLPSSIIC